MSMHKYVAKHATIIPDKGMIEIEDGHYFGGFIITLENVTMTITDGTLYVEGDQVYYYVPTSFGEYVKVDDIDKVKYIVCDDQVEERYISFIDFILRKKTAVIKRHARLLVRERTKYSYMINPFKILNLHKATKQ